MTREESKPTAKPSTDPWLRLIEYTLLLRVKPVSPETRAQILERILAIEKEARP